ncbi:MAG: phosphate acetyltransferase [Oscillospiraceae bacterium]|nr:phosphate acetyltransferase [Oscillospiraceae bacterium]
MSVFTDKLKARAKNDIKTIVLAEGEEIRTLRAAEIVKKEGYAKLILLGNKEKIEQKANSEKIDIAGIKIIDPETDDKREEYANMFYELRKSKGVTPDAAKETVKNTLYYGVMMVKAGEADGMVAGAVNSSANVLRPSLQVLKTAPGTKCVSAFFVMVVPDCEYGANGTFIFADCALNEDPDAETVAEIALSSAKSFENLVGEEPIVAMTSYSTYGSAKSCLVEKMQNATKLAKEKNPSLKLDGELQADAAIVPEIGKSKAPGSDIAGKANVLVFPTIDTGNIAYKLVQRLAKAEAYGPILQGIAKPVNDLSRGCSAEDIAGVIAVTCVQAQQN